MTLPRRIPKPEKRASRWRSQAHCTWVRGFACANCGDTAAIEVAHVRIGSGAGMSQKPCDHRTAPLCKGCHTRQHTIGERTFWQEYQATHGQSVEQLLAELQMASPKAREIRDAMRERENAA